MLILNVFLKKLILLNVNQIIIHTQESIKIMLLEVLLINLFLLIIIIVKKLFCIGPDAVNKFIKLILNENNYCGKVVKKHCNKDLIMPAEEEERFEQSNIYWICNKLFDVSDEKVRDHCHISGKYRGATHWSYNINLKITKKVPVIFHNLKGYDSHLTFKELSIFKVKICVIPNGLEKYMVFTINKNIVFIDSMQFMNSSIDLLVKNLKDKNFKYLSE